MTKKILGVGFGLAAGLAVIGGGPASAQGTVTIVDSSLQAGEDVSLAVTPAGTAFVAYYDRASGDLRLARCLDAGCTAAALTTMDAAGDVGQGADLTIGADGRAVASYADRTTGALKIARCDDAACTSATARVVDPVALAPQADTAIVTGADGLPLVAYVTAGNRLKAVHCSVADCSSWTVSDLAPAPADAPALAIASDGRATIELGNAFTPSFFHCADVACSTVALDARAAAPTVPDAFWTYASPSLGRLGNGRLLGAVHVTFTDPLGQQLYLSFVRCDITTCVSLDTEPTPRTFTSVGSYPDGRGLVAYHQGGQVHLRSCSNADCTNWTETCTIGATSEYEVGAAADGAPLLAFHLDGGGVGVAHAPSQVCGLPSVSALDATAFESAGQMDFRLQLTAPTAGGETVAYQTLDGTAQAGADYVATSGVVTFAPGQTSATVTVPLLPDALTEGDETFALTLSAAAGVVIGDGHAVGLIRDGAPLPQLVAGDCQAVEGDAGLQGCVFTVDLVPAAGPGGASVDYETSDDSAEAGVDYVAASGTLTFAPGATSATVTVSVIGDTAVELDEAFFLGLFGPTNATVLDGTGRGVIVDDDAASLSSIELTHGARLTADLAAQAGPTADTDYYRVGQTPFSSYEAVVDAVSGDVAPGLTLTLLAEDNQTPLALSAPVGTGSAVAMRWFHQAGAETRQTVRVGGAACGALCGPDDTYRLRFYETTAHIPRFNNSATQRTVLLLQNRTDAPQLILIHYWDANGVRLLSQPGHLDARQIVVVDTSSAAWPEVATASGSITITGTGGYGDLAGKAVALEPATGFSFDSPLTYKPR